MGKKEVETGITLYEMSKQVVKNLPARKTHAELEPCRAILRKFKKLGYFMLMCREENYYTVIHVRKKKKLPHNSHCAEAKLYIRLVNN